VLLEHYVDSRTQWMTHGNLDLDFGDAVSRHWTADFAFPPSAPSAMEHADSFVLSAAGRLDRAWSGEARGFGTQ
jgi:hypothetical protein